MLLALLAPALALDIDLSVRIDAATTTLHLVGVADGPLPLISVAQDGGRTAWVQTDIARTADGQVVYGFTVTDGDPRTGEPKVLSKPRVTALVGQPALVRQESTGRKRQVLEIEAIATEG